MNRAILILLAAIVVGSAGFGIIQLNDIRLLKESLAALDLERAALQKRIWDLQKRNADLEHRLAQTGGSGTQAGGDFAGELSANPDGAAAAARVRGGMNGARFAAIMADPGVQKLMAVQQKAGLDSRFAPLFKQLNLSPADLEKFKNLLVEKQSAVMDVLAAARGEGLNGPGGRDQVRQLVQDAQAEVDSTIRSTLGDAAYAQYQTYEATLPQRTVVNQLDQRLSYSTSPLTDTQSTQLVQILAQTAPTNSSAGTGSVAQLLAGTGRGGPLAGSTPITNGAIAQAQTILAPDQVAALQSLQQEQQAAALLRRQMRAGFGGQVQGTAAPAGSTPQPAGPGGP